MSDNLLRPVHGLLEWCEWLVLDDMGETLSILTVPVTATEYHCLKYETVFPVLNVTSHYFVIIPHTNTNTFS